MLAKMRARDGTRNAQPPRSKGNVVEEEERASPSLPEARSTWRLQPGGMGDGLMSGAKRCVPRRHEKKKGQSGKGGKSVAQLAAPGCEAPGAFSRAAWVMD
jgi:hypothetical protein